MGNEKFQNKYRIPSTRAAWHDYNGGSYFITICTAGRKSYFGHIVNEKMVLNVMGQKLNDLIKEIPIHHPYAEITVSQIMPNHVHLIVCIDEMLQTGRDVACRVFMEGYAVADCRDAAGHVSTGKNEKMQATAQKCGLLSTTMGGMKSAITRFANDNKIEFGWQSRFHDHIIRDAEEYDRIAQYIRDNPATWLNDKFYSASDS